MAMQCARHPKVETDLFCARCETPVCPKCLVHAEVGIRCRKCSPRPLFGGRNISIGGGTLLIGGIIAGLVAIQVIGTANNQVPAIPGEFRPVSLSYEGIGDASAGGEPQLDLSSVNCTRVDAAAVTSCQGYVHNVSPLTMDVDVVIEWLGGGEVAATDRAPITFNPILPAQTSAWVIPQASYNPEFDEYRVSFAGPDGPIPADGP